jgi:two-component system sensor histidine kinase AtoS
VSVTGWRRRLGLGSLQGKFLWAAVLVLALVMGAVLVVVEHRQRAAIIQEVLERGHVLARSLAATSSAPLLLYNFTALEQNVARVGSEQDVVYAIVLDADGKVAAHNRLPELVGLALEGPVHEQAAGTTTAFVQETLSERRRQPLFDFAVPVTVNGQRWGVVRVGLSKRRMEEEIRKTRRELGALSAVTLLLGALAAALVASRIARPVQQLAAGVSAISRGELNQRIEPATADEIGQLAVAFNHMAAQLFEQRSALEEAHGELRHRFEELHDLKSYTDSILRSLTSGIVTVDLDGRIVTLNPAAELLTGYFAGEAASRYCTEVFAQTPDIGEILMETLATRAGVAGVPVALKRRNGSALEVEFSTAPLRAGEGKDLGVVGMFRDLTAVRELERQLRRSDRLAAIGTLAAGLAHEIKNPLTSLLTFTRHLERRFDDELFREKFRRVVPRELERINAIVERLLELARPTELALEPVRLPALLERVVELYDNEIDAKQVRVSREYARDLPRVQADAEALYRALVNLVGNALDAVGRSGHIVLRAGWSDGAVAIGRAGRRRGRWIHIEIQDDGPGIAPGDADRIFTPFFTSKETGTGLGLAITHKIVEDHGGVIDFRSAPAGGTVFRMLLPLRPASGARDPGEIR